MKGKNLLIVVGLLAVLVGVTLFIQGRKQQSANQTSAPENKAIAQARSSSTPPLHPFNTETSQVPAHYEVAPASAELGAVLPAAQFTGKTREASLSASTNLPSLTHISVQDLSSPMPDMCFKPQWDKTGQEKAREFAGQKVKVTGRLSGNTIKVTAIEVAT